LTLFGIRSGATPLPINSPWRRSN